MIFNRKKGGLVKPPLSLLKFSHNLCQLLRQPGMSLRRQMQRILLRRLNILCSVKKYAMVFFCRHPIPLGKFPRAFYSLLGK